MKITKRQLNKIIKEEIYATLEGVLGEQELEVMGEVPFEGAGHVEPKPEGDVQAQQEELYRMEKRLKNLIADASIPEEIKQERIRTLLNAIEEFERLGS